VREPVYEPAHHRPASEPVAAHQPPAQPSYEPAPAEPERQRYVELPPSELRPPRVQRPVPLDDDLDVPDFLK
jgi:hypothetical protein